ncbi:MAG TPA: hypothetical protein VEI97_06110, partial [bacterium]|nr:hypothetical protein [bacterium]
AFPPETPPASLPNDAITVDVGSEWGSVAVAASASIKDPETLFERSGLDPDVWEIVPDSAKLRKWDVPMKLGTGEDAEPVVIPCYYVAINVRKRWEATELPRPVVLKVTRPRLPSSSPGPFASVHYSDIHFPHHDPRALNILYQILDYIRPGLVVDHGDTLDCAEIGRWPKDPNNRVSLKEEIVMGAEHIGVVHALTPEAGHVWLEGNHEERLKRLIWGLADQRAAGEILTLEPVRKALEWGSLLGLDSLGWEVVPYPKHKLLFDRLVLKHGNSVRKHSSYSAREEHDKYGKSGLSGHTHRQGGYWHRDYNGVHAWWELGLLGQIREDYVDHANWQQGLACITWSDDRTRYGVELISIHDGVTYFRGRR